MGVYDVLPKAKLPLSSSAVEKIYALAILWVFTTFCRRQNVRL